MNAYNAYLRSLNTFFWEYARAESLLDGSILDQVQDDLDRPPVFHESEANRNILMPTGCDRPVRKAIERSLPTEERHRWFHSMRSSQALAQSVFGNLIVEGKLGLLSGLESDQRLPAFCDDLERAKALLEFRVDYLGEPRSTSIDLWIEGLGRVAVECKLTEPEFGTCSRPRLSIEKDKNYRRDYCDGSYSRQEGRQTRCALSEIGVTYWKHVPKIFQWQSGHDLAICPLRETYQLARNIIAACVGPNEHVTTNNAHALVVYDTRNPAFQVGGKAREQWNATREALKNIQLLRSCSWQSIVDRLEQSREVDGLVAQLRKKYGF